MKDAVYFAVIAINQLLDNFFDPRDYHLPQRFSLIPQLQ